MSSRDSRYGHIPIEIVKGNIKTLRDLFLFIPRTVVANDLGIKVSRLTKQIENVRKFTLQELAQIAGLCGVDEKVVFRLAENEFYIQKEAKLPNSDHQIKKFKANLSVS